METIYEQIDRYAGYRMPGSEHLPVLVDKPENEMYMKKKCTIEIGELVFTFHTTRGGSYYLHWPREILDFTIIGVAGCEPCKTFAKRFPMMDKITLVDTGLLQREVKKKLYELFPEGDLKFPLLMSRCGNTVIPGQALERIFNANEA